MKLVCKNLEPDGSGRVEMIAEEPDDLWYVYNLIAKGDKVSAVTLREVIKETDSGKRLDPKRLKLTIELEVEDIDFDKEGPFLHISGVNIKDTEHIRVGGMKQVGKFHSLEIEKHRPFVLSKDVWDSLALDILHEACDPAGSADLAVVLMQEGLARFFLIGKRSCAYIYHEAFYSIIPFNIMFGTTSNIITTTRSRIESSIPHKHEPAIAGYEKALNKFFEKVLQAFLKHVDFKVVRCAVLASPGFTEDQFHSYLLLEAERQQLRPIIANKSRLVLAHVTSGYKHSLKEVLNTPAVMSLIKDTKAAQEVRVLEDFLTMFSNDPARACYGPKHVQCAHENLAVFETLLITDELFRNSDVDTRKKYVNLVDSVKASSGKVYIFSTMHASGEQLSHMMGIAAILQSPMPELEDLEM